MLSFDLRDALRGLARDRLYATITVLTLALTIGATTAVFSIVDGVLLKPLPYENPHQLVAVNEVVRELADKYPMLPVNARHFELWREKASAFSSLAEFLRMPANLTGLGEPAQIQIVRTSGTLFEVLGVRPELGRLLTRADERQAQPAVAVVSHAMWRDRMHADPAAVGRPITVGGVQHTVVGVLPAGVTIPQPGDFRSPGELSARTEVFLPLRLDLANISPMGEFNHTVVGRLRPGATATAAQSELDVLQAEIAREAEKQTHEAVGLRALVRPLGDSIVSASRQSLLLLLAAIAAVLLVACANLANLSLTRTLARLRDAAIRTALGATRARLVALSAAEQMILALAGGTLGLGIAFAALKVFVTTAPVDLPRAAEVAIDARVLAFAAIVSILSGLVVAVLPAWRISGRDVHVVLRGGSFGTTADRGGLRLRSTLLVVQVGLSVALLALTAVLTMSFQKLLRADRGFSTDGVVAIDISLPASRYADASKRTAVYDALLERVQALPGVSSASWVSVLPLTGETWVDLIVAEGDKRPFVQLPPANYRFVAPDYFRTIGMPVTRGRSFTSAELKQAQADVPAVITARTAATVWPGVDPIGRRFLRGDPKEKPFEVVGVVPDGRNTRIDAVSPLMVYVPYSYRSRVTASLVLQTRLDDSAVANQVHTAVRGVDPDVAIARVRPLQQLVDDALASRRYQAALFVAFGAVALVIATIGVYAVTSYGVSRRRREMNIRVAFGATTGQVRALVLRQAAVPLAVGILAGVIAAAAMGGVVASLLFEVNARDPRVIAAVAALVGGVGLASAFAAARHALLLDPAATLRQE